MNEALLNGKENEENLNGMEGLADFSGGGIPFIDADRADSEAYPATDSLVDFGVFAQDLDLSGLFPEDGIFGAPDVDEAPFNAALSNIQKTGRGVNKRLAMTSYSEDDFEPGPPRKAFILIRHYKNKIFKKGAKVHEILDAASFVFGRTEVGKMNFDLCCEVLNARRDILRMRFHYEFSLRWMVFPHAFPFMIDPLPDVLDREIMGHISTEAVDLANEAWMQPGITTERLIRQAFEGEELTQTRVDQAKKWLDEMEARHLMARHAENWYLIGRDPMRRQMETIHSQQRRGGSINWSRLW